MATERPLNREEQHAIASGLASIIATWGLDQSAPPRELLAWVQAHLDRIKDGEVACPDEDGIVAIGVLLNFNMVEGGAVSWAAGSYTIFS